MEFNFDHPIDRLKSNSIKWKLYEPDVLPLWVADMDFAVPAPIQSTLRTMVDHGIYGYEMASLELRQTVARRMQNLYQWDVNPDMVVATPGVVAGFTAAAHAVCTEGQAILVQPPVYPPFLKLSAQTGLLRRDAPLAASVVGSRLDYHIDFDVFEQAVCSGASKTAMFLLCNPQNPTGQVYTSAELARMGEICLENDVVICSDEIHSELLLGGAQHHPVAALDPRIAARTITLIAPSKTFNIPGLFCGFAIIPDKELLERYKKSVERLALHVNSFGLGAAQAAFSGECDEWLQALQAYLTSNRDFLVAWLKAELPEVRMTIPDATYLAWLDFSSLVNAGKINDVPAKFFLERARVALNNGSDFGPGGDGFVRLNFGCPRSILAEALERINTSLRL